MLANAKHYTVNSRVIYDLLWSDMFRAFGLPSTADHDQLNSAYDRAFVMSVSIKFYFRYWLLESSFQL